MSEPDFDIAILGGGPTGCALALMLARATHRPDRIALFQSDQAASYGYVPEKDPRVLAINHGSRVLLESLKGFPNVAAGIRTIHVSQRGRLGNTLIKHTDFDVPQLGCVVRYGQLHTALRQAVETSGVRIFAGAVAEITGQDSFSVRIDQDQNRVSAAMAVQADGRPGKLADRTYSQMALVTQAKSGLPRSGWAFERFTREGPLAVLPHPEASDQQSIVWCCSPVRAAELQALSADQFSGALTHMFGERLGTLTINGPVTAFPLTLNLNHQLVDGRIVAIGNAAQTLHPVAGQGLNLGLRDAATLAQTLKPWLVNPTRSPIGDLERFQQTRKSDRQVTVRLTDLMSRAFTTGLPQIEHAAGLTLLAMDMFPALRAPLARHLLQGLRA